MSESIPQRRPILSLAVHARDIGDREKLERAMGELIQSYPADEFRVESRDGQTVLCGMSELELEEICDHLIRRYKIPLDMGDPSVMYLETIRKPAEAEGKYIRQTGGSGNYGHCKIRLNPSKAGTGYSFVNEIRNGAIPAEFIEQIDQGIREALKGGILSGFPVVDVTATLYDGSSHDADSNAMAFRIAGSLAAKEAVRKASPIVLEPMMSVDVAVPEAYVGAILGDLNRRRGRIEAIEHRADLQAVRAIVPLAEMLGYARQMQDSARGTFDSSIRFARYEPAPRRGGEEAGATAGKPKGPRPLIDFAAPAPEAEIEGW